jgi:hypothetical protein
MNPSAASDGSGTSSASGRRLPTMIFAWFMVGVPLLWGVAQTIKRALALFH